LASEEEYIVYYRLANTAFASDGSEEAAQRRLQSSLQSPDFRAERVRGAFRDQQLLGGYTVHDRNLRMGAARLSVGGIGSVVTAPEARKQGVARALMQDAIAFARNNRHVLLLLDGIPNFYYRFGYTDMFDVTIVEIDRSAILAYPPAGLSVRLATVEDAAAIVELYQRHFGAYTGSFERSLEIQKYRLMNEQRPLLVAHSSQGEIKGYLRHGIEDELAQGQEVAADSWDALLTLLRYHAELFDASTAPQALQYFLPADAPMTDWAIDKLEVPDTSQWESPAQEWGVRSITYHHRFTGWMACLTDFPLLADAIVPELQARWQRSLARWSGAFRISVDGQTRCLRINDRDIAWSDDAGSSAFSLAFTAQEFVQLLFGYRPVTRLVDAAHLSHEARAALAMLFPVGHTWIPRTDWF
jgi:predicted N-acetyltransferase YhbS